MDKKKAAQIIHDRDVNGLSYRNLGIKYGMAHAGIYAMINKGKPSSVLKPEEEQPHTAPQDALPDDVKTLKEELRKAKLKIELQDLMIDIASKELGVDIRKKSGTRRSK